MRRWTLLSRAERGGVILSGAWTTSTCYKPREIERSFLAKRAQPTLLLIHSLLIIQNIFITFEYLQFLVKMCDI